MRVIQTYTFKLSPKTPFSDCPSIVHRFLEEQNLTSHHFLYYFSESIYSYRETAEEKLVSGSCAKAVKDCPALGSIRFFDGQSPYLYLSNIDQETSCTEADILPYMRKIHRRYGFFKSDLYYYDIDFFGKVIPYGRGLSNNKHHSAEFEESLKHSWFPPYGSGIHLQRYSYGGNEIILSVDILHNGTIHDPSPYFEAMKTLLPHIQPSVSMEIYLTDEEKQKVQSVYEQIQPAVEKARNFFAQHFPSKDRQNISPSSYTLASKLKKMAKKYDFFYHYEGFGCYVLDKRTPRGHALRVWVDSGPSHFDTTYHINIQGIGFCHELYKTMQTPTNQAESDECTEKMFSLISEFEKALLPELDAFYLETPDWFVPSVW